MSEYIKREDAIKVVNKAVFQDVALDSIAKLPSADVVEVGKWYKFGKEYYIEAETNGYGYKAFRIMKPDNSDVFLKVYKDGKDGDKE